MTRSTINVIFPVINPAIEEKDLIAEAVTALADYINADPRIANPEWENLTHRLYERRDGQVLSIRLPVTAAGIKQKLSFTIN